ncbi:hypothetical protein [Legionella sp. PC997]|uniref:hypothetical protein n=1 Tax=Legionella sp. PC997 TaxID=2755562 RepID=UPI0015F88264|nr:hypothetical protein [Legionella sp. PC997]QMT59730.1 hypothetical protein HBNCFIEN_01097 [Legionella sp. PC997]
MDNTDISDDVRRFILNSVPSIPYLEVILLMRNEPHREWSLHDVAQRIFISDSSAEEILRQLLNAGVIMVSTQWPPLYQFYPRDDFLKNILDQLAATYSTHLIEVTNLIHSNIDQKAHRFANAFTWKKDT